VFVEWDIVTFRPEAEEKRVTSTLLSA
jgi:hypothetical protein